MNMHNALPPPNTRLIKVFMVDRMLVLAAKSFGHKSRVIIFFVIRQLNILLNFLSEVVDSDNESQGPGTGQGDDLLTRNPEPKPLFV